MTGATAFLLAILAAGLTAVTPDMIQWAGAWVPVLMAVIITAAAYITPNGDVS